MADLNKISNTIKATQGLDEIKRQVNDVKNSNLTDDEKNKALKSHDKMVKTTIIVTISIILLFIIICCVICNVVNDDLKVILCLITTVLGTISLIFFSIFQRKLFSDWQNAYEKVDYGFDGLTSDEINKLKPNDKEELLIRKYKKKSLIGALIYLLVLAIEFSIILNLEIAVLSPITIIITIIITVVWYVFEDDYQVSIHRIKSGYYKKSIGFICQKCKNEIKIDFEDLEKYNSLPKNKQGIRIISCSNCGNFVPLYNYDVTLKDYKGYLNKTK